MKIFNHFQNINLTQDQHNSLEKLSLFLESNGQVFVLQGYAGSGKTTLLKGLIQYLLELKKAFDVMAPTGRAAKILKDKTGYGQTIHRNIYNFKELQTLQNKDIKDDHSFHYVFPIDLNDFDDKILIIDEASMISSRESKNEIFSFGTGVLLDDLLTYSRVPHSNNKIIFVGDPAQLPPVGDNTSKALIPKYFLDLRIKTQHVILEQVVRQKENIILKNSIKIRKLISSDNKNELTLDYDQDSFIKSQSENLAQQYYEKFPIPEIGDSVIIAFSNAQCLNYNRAVRGKIFPNYEYVTSGDLLIITHNNYHTYGFDLMNGEMAKVMEASQSIIPRKNIPVYETVNGKRIKKHITLHFRKIVIRVENLSEEIECLIIDSLLNSPHRDLTISEMKALYIDFVMRFQSEQSKRKENKLTFYRVGSSQFKDQLRTDKYFNALRVKYGYAITCHKAQGGEWLTTFVDYYGRTSLNEDPLRWSYTATTRAINRCYAANAPNVNFLSSFNVGDIRALTNIPPNVLTLNNIPLSPYHSADQHKAKSLKYWEINEKLEHTKFQIESVNSFGGFQERYTISLFDEKEQFDAHHNGAGLFNKFTAVHPDKNEWHKEVLELLNKTYHITFNIDYNPSNNFLERLYGLIQSLCSDVGITITNIEERRASYFVTYYLKTDGKCALIQFYFNGREQLTRALPKSTEGNEDEKLNQLISKLQAYVI